MREDDRRLHLANDRGEAAHGLQVIGNLHVVAKTRMEMRAQNFRGATSSAARIWRSVAAGWRVLPQQPLAMFR